MKAGSQRAELESLERRIRTILPEQYREAYEEVRASAMGSAGLKYGEDGKVAWDEMWGSFCDLAMAGGPPHKGTLLEPGAPAEIAAQKDPYQEVVSEICRGIEMTANLTAEESANPGWVRVNCVNRSTVDWLLRAITMENVAVRADGLDLELPAGPDYRMEKEIKNVITVMAKSSHYWFGHVYREQREEIRELFAVLEREAPLLQPMAADFKSCETVRSRMCDAARSAGLQISNHGYDGWLGIEYPDVRSAIWVMRALVASNVLARREDTVLFLPVDPVHDPSGEKAIGMTVRLNGLVAGRGVS